MPAMTMVQALNSAMDIMLARDRDVVIFGEDVGYFGGVFRATDGLQRKHGKERVFDTPIAEGGILGVAVGMGAYGLRPVAEVQFADYIYPAMDQLVSEAARLRYRSAGEWWAPITVRAPCGGGIATSRVAPYFASGSSIVNVAPVPMPSLSAQTRPPCNST